MNNGFGRKRRSTEEPEEDHEVSHIAHTELGWHGQSTDTFVRIFLWEHDHEKMEAEK